MTAVQFGLVASTIGWIVAVVIWINVRDRARRSQLTQAARDAEDQDYEPW